MTDNMFKTLGKTVVSSQKQHIDIFGVFFAPEIHRLSELTKNEDMKRLAKVMLRLVDRSQIRMEARVNECNIPIMHKLAAIPNIGPFSG